MASSRQATKEEGAQSGARTATDVNKERTNQRGAEERGVGGILGAIGSVKDAIKDKLSPQPAEETRRELGKDAHVSYGGAGEPQKGHRLAVDEEGTPVVVKIMDDVDR